MKAFALFVAFMVLLNTMGGAFAYTYTESFAGVSGPSEWTNLSRGFDVDYVSGGSVNYYVSDIAGSCVINNETHTAYREFVVNSSMVAADQNDFPMMLVINLPSGVNTSGSNVRITDGSDNPRPREIEDYNESSNDLALFFSGNINSTVDTVFRVYYGNVGLNEPAADSTYGSQAVWDVNYVYVSHMADVTTSTIKDSTSNGRTSTKLSSNNPIEYDAEYGKSQDFSSDHITIPDSADFDFTDFTFESYHYKDTDVSGAIMSKFYDGSTRSWEFSDNCVSDYMTCYVNAAGTPSVLSAVDSVPIQNWYYTAVRHDDSSTSQWYVDGLASGSAVDIDAVNANAAGVKIGDRSHAASRIYFDGKISELRLSNILRSTGYVSTTSNNINNPTASGTDPFYLSIGAEQIFSGSITITPRPESGTNGTSVYLSETNTSAISILNLGGLTILQNIENLFNNSATVDYANYTINYTTHAVLRSPVNTSSFYGSATLEWYTNPQGTSATYYVAVDPNFFSVVAQGTTTQENTTLSLSPDTYYWKVAVGAVESDVWQFTINDTPPVPGLFNFSVYDESTFAALSSFDVKIYNDTWYNEKSTSNGSLVFNSSEVVAGEYTALINANGYSPRWRVVESPANVSAYLPNTTKQIWLINFNLIDYTNLFSYSTSRLILTKPTSNLGIITVSDSYFDASGSNPVYLIDYNNYILTLRNNAGYEKSVGSYLPIQHTQTSLVVGEITTLPDTEAHGGFAWNITKSNTSIVLMWVAPEGSLTEAFQYNVTNSTSGAVEYEINTIAPYGTATFYIPAESDTVWLIQLSASTSDGAVYHKESYRVSQQMIDFELSDYWYNVYSMFLLIIMGLLFGYKNARTGAVVVSFSAAALAIMGLLHVPASVLAMAVTISVLSKMAERMK